MENSSIDLKSVLVIRTCGQQFLPADECLLLFRISGHHTPQGTPVFGLWLGDLVIPKALSWPQAPTLPKPKTTLCSGWILCKVIGNEVLVSILHQNHNNQRMKCNNDPPSPVNKPQVHYNFMCT